MNRKTAKQELKNNSSAKNGQKQTIILVICLLLFGFVIFWLLQLGEDNYIEDGDSQNAVFSEYFLDSSENGSGRTAAETLELLNTVDCERVAAAALLMNAGLSAGRYVSLTEGQDKDDPEKMSKLFFAEGLQYTETEMWRYGTEYSFYVSFADGDGKLITTVFVIDPDTIRCDGYFFRTSQTLDYTNLIRKRD